jgi:hypothetical protein
MALVLTAAIKALHRSFSMKITATILGITGSALVLAYAVPLAFFSGALIHPQSAVLDSLVIIVSGILGLFGGACAIAGGAFATRDRQLSGILLTGAAVSCAIMFGSLIALLDIMHITRFSKYIVLATGIIASAALSAGGAIMLRGKAVVQS